MSHLFTNHTLLNVIIKKLIEKKKMPQLDINIAMSQVLWFTVVFTIFYIFMVKNILPQLARSIKLRKKKIVGKEAEDSSSKNNETSILNKEIEGNLIPSVISTQSLLLDIYSSSASWYETSLKETNTKILYNSNVLYLKTVAELIGSTSILEKKIKKN